GRGCLAGPVVAAAVILDRRSRLPGVRDSKLLSEAQRRQQFGCIVLSAIAYGFGVADAEMVDRMNVVGATREAMREAVVSLCWPPDALLIDAVALPDLEIGRASCRERVWLGVVAAPVESQTHERVVRWT